MSLNNYRSFGEMRNLKIFEGLFKLFSIKGILETLKNNKYLRDIFLSIKGCIVEIIGFASPLLQQY